MRSLSLLACKTLSYAHACTDDSGRVYFHWRCLYVCLLFICLCYFQACVFPYCLSAFRLLTDSSSDYNIYSLHLNMFVHALGKEPIIPHGHQSEYFSVYLSLGSHKLPVCLRGSPMKPQWQKLASLAQEICTI